MELELRSEEVQGADEIGGRALGGCPLSHGPPEAPPTSTPTPYIPFHREKIGEKVSFAFYDTEPPPSPNLSREG